VSKIEISNLILGLLATSGIAVLKLFPQFFLPSYLKRKGENKATFEDIGKITERVKEVESKYSKELERLKAKLAMACQVSNKQFELELKAYEQIWASLVRVRNAFHFHRQMVKINIEETPEQNDVNNYAALFDSLKSLNEVVENHRPFYSPNIWKSMRELCDLISYEGNMDVGNRGLVASRPEFQVIQQFWDEKRKKKDEINKAIDAVCEAIRKRIFELGNP
jgi:hypothetical protein